MSERTDNLKAVLIENKSKFLLDAINGEVNTEGVLVVDLIGYDVQTLDYYSVAMVNDSRYMWIQKIHE